MIHSSELRLKGLSRELDVGIHVIWFPFGQKYKLRKIG